MLPQHGSDKQQFSHRLVILLFEGSHHLHKAAAFKATTICLLSTFKQKKGPSNKE
jgi:hypothetical protein